MNVNSLSPSHSAPSAEVPVFVYALAIWDLHIIWKKRPNQFRYNLHIFKRDRVCCGAF